MTHDEIARKTLRLSVLVHARGFFMPIWNIQTIVERGLVREFLAHCAAERRMNHKRTAKRVNGK